MREVLAFLCLLHTEMVNILRSANSRFLCMQACSFRFRCEDIDSPLSLCLRRRVAAYYFSRFFFFFFLLPLKAFFLRLNKTKEMTLPGT